VKKTRTIATMRLNKLFEGKTAYFDLAKVGKQFCPIKLPARFSASSVAASIVAGNGNRSLIHSIPLLEQGESEKSQGVWGTASPRAWRRCMAAEIGTSSKVRDLKRKERVSRFPPIDPVGNGNGKRLFVAGWPKDERPPVPVRQKV
jgi:hypothetical protein